MYKMNQEKLIENVKNFECLYKMYHPKYSDNIFKETIWREIAKEMKQPAAVCKKAWVNLRDSFRRDLKKKRETKSGQAALKMKKWKFEDEMSFLLPFMQERDTCSNLKNESDDDDDEPNEDEYNDKNNYGEDESDDKRVDRYDNKNDDKNDDMDKEVYSKNCKGEKKQKEMNKKINVAKSKEDSQPQSETASAVMMKYLLDKKNTKAQIIPPIQQPDATDMFFSSIAATVKNFCPYYQNIAKSQIFSIVTDLEMKQIIQGQSEQRQGFVPITSIQRSAQMRPHHTGYNILHPAASRLPSPSSTISTTSSSSIITTPIPSPSHFDYPGTVPMPHHSEETGYTDI